MAPLPIRLWILTALLVSTSRAADDESAKIKFAECPAAVQQAFREAAKGASFDTVETTTVDEESVYQVKVAIGKKSYSISLDQDGTLIEKTLDLVDGKREISFTEAPAAVQTTFRSEAAGAQLKTLEKRTDSGRLVYGGAATLEGKSYWLLVAADGTLVEQTLDLDTKEHEIDFAECPAAVQKSLRAHSGDAPIKKVNRTTLGFHVVYQVGIIQAGKNYELIVTEEGSLIQKRLNPAVVEVELAHCPAAVQQTLREETKGAKLDAIDKVLEEHGAVYETTVTIAGNVYDLSVAEDGTLLFKTLVEVAEEKK